MNRKQTKCINFNKGFTLIEILIVVVIVSIVSVVGVQMINSGSVERILKHRGDILKSSIEYICDQAILQNIPYGIKVANQAYSFAQFVNQEWLDVFSQELEINQNFNDGTQLSLEIEDQIVNLNDEFDEIPQILCDSSGELSNFTLVFAVDEHAYQLKTIDYWKIQGDWIE